MVHVIFLLKTSHTLDYHKNCFTNFGAQKLEILIFARLQEIWIWIKENEGSDVSLTTSPMRQVRLSHDRDDVHRWFLCDSEVSGQTKGTNVIPRPLRTGWPSFPHGGATGKGSPSTMAARRRCSALSRSSQAGRAWPRVSYSNSKLWRSFLGRWQAWNGVERADHERAELRRKHGGAACRVWRRWVR